MSVSAVAVLRTAIRRFIQDQGFVLASALSFAFVLCLAPLALLLFSVAGFLFESEEIAEYLFDTSMLLLPAYGNELAAFLSLLAAERAVTGLLGVVSWAVFATQLFSLVRTVLNRVFQVRVRRRWFHGFAVDLLGVVLVGSLAVGFAMLLVALVALSDFAVRMSPLPLPESVHLRRTFSLPVIYVSGFGLLFFVYRTFPNTWVPVRAAMIGTVVVAALWEAARWGFAAYVGASGVYGRLYGSFGIGVATLVWIYYSAVIFVFGGEIAAATTERRVPAALRVTGVPVELGEPAPVAPDPHAASDRGADVAGRPGAR